MRRRALGIVVAVAALVAVAATVGSRLAARRLAAVVGTRSGLLVTIGDLGLSLFPPGVAAVDVAVRAPGSAAPALVAERILVRGDWRQLVAGRRRIERLELVRPRLRLARQPDGRLAAAGLGNERAPAKAPRPAPAATPHRTPAAGTGAPAAGTAAPAAGATAPAPGQPGRPALLIAALEIRDGVVRLDDRALTPPRATSLRIPRLEARAATLAADGTLARLAWSGTMRLGAARGDVAARYRTRADGVDLRVRATLAGVALAALAPWLPVPDVRAGTLRGHVEHLWSTGPAARHRLRGSVAVGALEAGSSARVRVGQLRADGIRADLRTRRALVERLQARHAAVAFGRTLEALLSTREARPAAGSGWEVVVGDTTIADARISVPDRPALQVRAARGHALSTGWPSDTVTFDAALASGGTLRARGVLDPGDGWIWARVKARDVALPAVATLPPPLAITDGRLSGVATVAAPPFALTDAALIVDRFGSQTRDPAGERPWLAWHAGRFRVARVSLAPESLHLARVALEYPYLVLRRLPAETRPEPGTATPEPEPPQDVRLDVLRLSDATVFLEDRTVEPFYLGSVSGLAVDGQALVLDPIRLGRVEARGLLNEVAPGRLAVAAADGGAHDVVADVDGLPLPPLASYFADVLGWRAERGDADVHASVTLSRDALAADAHLEIADLQLVPAGADRIGGRIGLPLAAAVALMKDHRGRLTLDLPLSGSPSAPSFAVGSLIAEATGRAIVGALTSPLTLLGAAFGPGESGERLTIQPIPFRPGSVALDAEGSRRTDLLAVLLAQRPQLRLAVRGAAGPADVDAGPTGVDLEALARARAAAVRDALSERHGVAASRLESADPATDAPPAVHVEPIG